MPIDTCEKYDYRVGLWYDALDRCDITFTASKQNFRRDQYVNLCSSVTYYHESVLYGPLEPKQGRGCLPI